VQQELSKYQLRRSRPLQANRKPPQGCWKYFVPRSNDELRDDEDFFCLSVTCIKPLNFSNIPSTISCRPRQRHEASQSKQCWIFKAQRNTTISTVPLQTNTALAEARPLYTAAVTEEGATTETSGAKAMARRHIYLCPWLPHASEYQRRRIMSPFTAHL
jgi:RNA:NAD 2'-phosphotransferase (TPT1/KptA family)